MQCCLGSRRTHELVFEQSSSLWTSRRVTLCKCQIYFSHLTTKPLIGWHWNWDLACSLGFRTCEGVVISCWCCRIHIRDMGPPHEGPDPSHSFPIVLFLWEGLVGVGSSSVMFLIWKFSLFDKNVHWGAIRKVGVGIGIHKRCAEPSSQCRWRPAGYLLRNWRFSTSQIWGSVGRGFPFWRFAGWLEDSLNRTMQIWSLLEAVRSSRSVTCLCESRSVTGASVPWAASEGLMNGLEEMTELAGGECAGVTFTEVKAGSGLSNVLANSKASNLLNLSDHFWSKSSILESTEDLDTDDLEGFSALDLLSVGTTLGLSDETVFFFCPELEPGDCKIPWSSTAPLPSQRTGLWERNWMSPAWVYQWIS